MDMPTQLHCIIATEKLSLFEFLFIPMHLNKVLEFMSTYIALAGQGK